LFTEHDTPALRARIQADLDLIAGEVARADPHLHALALTGGFARGEGTARDGRPVNDYDLIAIRRRPGGGARYRALAEDLTRRVGIEVDLLPIHRARLLRVQPKLFWLDARLGSRMLRGDERALDALPPLAATDLPPIEGARLLANRAAGLLLALPAHGPPLDPALQAAKAVLAAMDAHLLARGAYAARLRERLAMSAAHPDAPLFARAVEWKLRPHAPSVGWDEAAGALLRAVDATGARGVRDGWTERAVHLLRARRVRLHPSRAVRLAAWDILAGPAKWPAARATFVQQRALTLQ
jgi:hypothetical protein